MDKILINKNKIKQTLALVFAIVFLTLLFLNNLKLKQMAKINAISSLNEINEENISPRELFLDSWYIIKTNYYKKNLNNQNWLRWKKHYLSKIKTKEDAYIAINSMLLSLDDPYSKFMSQEEFLNQNNAINSKLYGIGINTASISGKIYVVNVLENAPAFHAGIQNGDIILKIDNEDIKGYTVYQISQMIRNSKNMNVELEILRGSEIINKTIKKEEIKVKTVQFKKISSDIGYIRISSLIGLESVQDFIIALNKLKSSKALILDLRGNSGGLVQNAILIANLFMNQGNIVTVVARHNKKNTYSAENEGCIYNNKLAVLIDNNSASAAEILAAALKDNNRAILIGTKTYGKGLVQKIFALPNKTGMNLTIARYLSPKGNEIDKIGVEPDYEVIFNHNDFLNGIDPQLNFAKSYLENELENKI